MPKAFANRTSSGKNRSSAALAAPLETMQHKELSASRTRFTEAREKAKVAQQRGPTGDVLWAGTLQELHEPLGLFLEPLGLGE